MASTTIGSGRPSSFSSPLTFQRVVEVEEDYGPSSSTFGSITASKARVERSFWTRFTRIQVQRSPLCRIQRWIRHERDSVLSCQLAERKCALQNCQFPIQEESRPKTFSLRNVISTMALRTAAGSKLYYLERRWIEFVQRLSSSKPRCSNTV